MIYLVTKTRPLGRTNFTDASSYFSEFLPILWHNGISFTNSFNPITFLSHSSVHNEEGATEGTISLKASLIFVFSPSLLVFMSFGAENRKRRHNLSCQADAVWYFWLILREIACNTVRSPPQHATEIASLNMWFFPLWHHSFLPIIMYEGTWKSIMM